MTTDDPEEAKGDESGPINDLEPPVLKKLWRCRMLVVFGAILVILGPFILMVECYTYGLPGEMVSDWGVQSVLEIAYGGHFEWAILMLSPGLVILFLAHLDRRNAGRRIPIMLLFASIVAIIFPIYLAWSASAMEGNPDIFHIYFDYWHYQTPGGTWSETSWSLYLGGILMSVGGAMALLGTSFRMRILKKAGLSHRPAKQ
jgi:hypothetical protein